MKMKQLLFLATAAFITNCTFASTASDYTTFQSLANKFKSSVTVTPKVDTKDITMGYAGQDLSHKKLLA